jgi:hypothetical protein
MAKIGRVNYTTMEDVPEGEQVLAGMFALNGYPIIILFDSSASHNFINKACTKKCQLTVMHLSTPYMISTLGEKIDTKYLAKKTPLNFVRKVYKGSLIILYGQGIDVILRMRWMKEFKALFDIVARTMQLLSPAHGMVVHQLLRILRTFMLHVSFWMYSPMTCEPCCWCSLHRQITGLSHLEISISE